jgi:pyruvate dehydrogenase E1 component beta subunit
MATLRMREALRDAMAEEMRRDENVFVMGEDVGVFQGSFKVTEGLLDEFGEKRVRDTPISENTIVGMGAGAAMGGLRPVVEIMTVNFALCDGPDREPRRDPHMFGGQVRSDGGSDARGGGHQLGPTHSHSFEAMFLQIPGCSSPARPPRRTPRTAEGGDPGRQPGDLHRTRDALRIARRGSRERQRIVNFGEAAIRREGSDVTIIGILGCPRRTAGRPTLANEHGVEAEVIDPRTLRPLDLDTSLESVRKTNRAVIVEEGWPHGGVGANLAALIQGQAFDHLDAPVERVTGADVHMPYSKRMEQAAIPHVEHVVSAALQTLEGTI